MSRTPLDPGNGEFKLRAPLIERLEAAVRSSKDPDSRAELMAQIACYQARVGEFDESERIRTELRSAYSDGHCPRVSIRIMCAESLLLFYRALDRAAARDRMFRANLLSVALSLPDLVSLTSAWMAHIDFNAGRFESMAKAASVSVGSMEADDGSAECRIALLLGDAFLYGGSEGVARDWYERARLAANRLGDHAAVGALTYNRGALHLARSRVEGLEDEIDPSRIALVCAEIRSAVNYQAVARLRSLDHLLRSAIASSLMLEGRFAEASVAILKLIGSSEVPSGSAELALLYSDNAFCLAKTGDWHLAAEMAAAAIEIDAGGFDFDDLALIYDGLAKYHGAIGDSGLAKEMRSKAAFSLSEHRETITRLNLLIAPLAFVSSLGK